MSTLALATLPPGPTQISDREWSWNAHCSEQLDGDEVPPEYTYSEPGSASTLTEQSLVSKRVLEALVGSKLQFDREKTYNDKTTSCKQSSFGNTPPCSRSEHEPKACAEEDEHEHNVHACRADHEQDVQTSTGDEEECCRELAWI